MSALERKFVKLANVAAVSPADLTMMIYGLGLLDCGTEETWALLEKLLLENFQSLKKIDFDNALAGFCTGSA